MFKLYFWRSFKKTLVITQNCKRLFFIKRTVDLQHKLKDKLIFSVNYQTNKTENSSANLRKIKNSKRIVITIKYKKYPTKRRLLS